MTPSDERDERDERDAPPPAAASGDRTTPTSATSATPAAPATASSPQPQPPAPAQRAYLIACAALIGACLAYWLPHWAGLPLLLYVPLERRWTFTPPLDTPAITYFGLLAWGAAGLLVGALLGAALTALPPLRRPLSPPALRVAGAWALTAFVLTGWYYTWNLWPF